MASLRDVARHAGVSVATASRVVSGVDNVRSETRERVERAMRELLYVPPGRRSETGVIGLLLPDFENPIFPALAQAIERRATEAGLASILCSTTAAAFREVDYVHTQQKQAGRAAALRFAGVDHDGLVAHAHFTVAGGRAALRRLLGTDEP